MAAVVAVVAVAVVQMLPVTCVAWAAAWAVLLPLAVTLTAVVLVAMVATLVVLPRMAVVAIADTVVDTATRLALLDHLPGGKSVVVSGEAVGSDWLLSFYLYAYCLTETIRTIH